MTLYAGFWPDCHPLRSHGCREDSGRRIEQFRWNIRSRNSSQRDSSRASSATCNGWSVLSHRTGLCDKREPINYDVKSSLVTSGESTRMSDRRILRESGFAEQRCHSISGSDFLRIGQSSQRLGNVAGRATMEGNRNGRPSNRETGAYSSVTFKT